MSEVQQRLVLAWDEFIESDEANEQFGFGDALNREDLYGTDKINPSYNKTYISKGGPADDIRYLTNIEKKTIYHLILELEFDGQISDMLGIREEVVSDVRKVFIAKTGISIDGWRVICPLCKKEVGCDRETKLFNRHRTGYKGGLCQNSHKSYAKYYKEADIESDELYSIAEVAKLLRVSAGWVENQVHNGNIKTSPSREIKLKDIPKNLELIRSGTQNIKTKMIAAARKALYDLPSHVFRNDDDLIRAIKKVLVVMKQTREKAIGERMVERKIGLPT